ncbi:MAG: lipoyl(octanoyl) transferase LipB [Planctomycetota bacterium]|jgi:lipoate-protein ligase B
MFTTAQKLVGGILTVRDCGLAGYRDVLRLQHQLHLKRRLGRIPDTVLIVEHPPVITLGARATANRLVADRDELAKRGLDLVQIRRGGGTTAHNPGQVVFYPILNLRHLGLGITEYIRKLEAIGAELLARRGLDSQSRKGFPGLWVDTRKIASIGVRVSRGVSCHGMAINVQNDLGIFDLLIPCGLDGVEMTSVLKETGRRHPMDTVKNTLAGLLVRHFSQSG